MSARAERWAWQVIDTVDLPPPERIVLLVLARKHTDAGGCFPSQETIAHLSGFRRRKVCDLLASLEAAGLIRRETTRTAGRFQKTRYHLFGRAHRAQTGAHGTVRKKSAR